MANKTLDLFYDLTLRIWTTTLGGVVEQGPIAGLVQGDVVTLNVKFVQSGAAVTLTAPVFTASSIKASGDFTGSYLIQLSAPTGSPPLYVFTVNPLNSANLNTFLQTYRNTWAVLEIYDSASGILTAPLMLEITPGYSLSGTPTDNAPGVISVAAGKTVTFPQSLTFPSALGTNGFQLSTDGAGTLTWAAAGGVTDGDKGDITVSNSGATWTIDNDVVGLAQLAHMATARVVGRTTPGNGSPELLTISGTGKVMMTGGPNVLNADTSSNQAIPAGTRIYSTDIANGGTLGGAVTFTLPSGSGYAAGESIIVADGGLNVFPAAGSIEIAPFSGQTIACEGVAPLAITTPGGFVQLVWDGTSAWALGACSPDVMAAMAIAIGSSLLPALGLGSLNALGPVTLSSGAATITDARIATSSVITLQYTGNGTPAVTTVRYKVVCSVGSAVVTALNAANSAVGSGNEELMVVLYY